MALANFLGAALLLQLDTAANFGRYAFAQVLIGLGVGISNAVFNSPLVVELAGSGKRRSEFEGSFGRACLITTTSGAALVAILVVATGGGLTEGGLFFLLAASFWLRWFFRALELASGNPGPAIRSDFAFGLVMLAAVAWLFFSSSASLATVVLGQIAASFAGILVFGGAAVAMVRRSIGATFGIFLSALRSRGRWALTGVIATEVTSNAHAYLLTLLLGPAAFAPIAAVTLYFRPVGIVLMGLTQFERPGMARHIDENRMERLASIVRIFRGMALFAWAGNSVLVFVLVFVFPALASSSDYSILDMQLSAILMSVVILLRSLREPEVAALQSAGEFRSLAYTTLISAPCTLVIIVFILHFSSWAVLTLIAVGIGESVIALLAHSSYRRLRLERMVAPK